MNYQHTIERVQAYANAVMIEAGDVKTWSPKVDGKIYHAWDLVRRLKKKSNGGNECVVNKGK
jgi:hypothetical protein